MLKSIKKFLNGFLVMLLACIGLSSSIVLASGGASFNNLPGDYEFIRGLNSSTGETNYVDPVTANAGDEVVVSMYYHNTDLQPDGSTGEAATNTRLRIILPTSEGVSHLLNGELWADNAAKVDGTYVNGVEVGNHGFTILSGNTSTLVEYVPGSVSWYPDRSATPVSLPAGQTGDEIITTNGLNIGDIQSCWQYAGFVNFKVRLRSPEVNFVRTKAAWNETKNVQASTVKAQAGDVIRYTLTTQNSGSDSGQQEISDDITDILEYATVTDLGGGTLNGKIITFGTVTIDGSQSVTNTFRVTIKNPLPLDGDFQITNIYGNQITVTIEKPPVGGEPILEVIKEVRNITTNTAFANGVLANKKDIVEYRIIMRNQHGEFAVEELNVKDILSGKVSYIPGTAKMTLAGKVRDLPDQFFTTGYLILDPKPSLGPKTDHDNLMITFEAKVSEDVVDDEVIVNKACGVAKNHSEVCDQAKVLIQIPGTPTPPTDFKPKIPDVATPQKGVPPQIPQTGPSEALALIFGLSSTAVTSGHYIRSRKLLKSALKMKKVL